MYQLVEKLRLQCSAVYCLSWLFSLRSFQSPSPSFLLLLLHHRFLSLPANYYLPVGEDSSPWSATRSHPRVSGTGTGKTFLFPLMWRGWQFRGVSHRGAASRTNKSLEGRRGAKGKTNLAEERGVQPFAGNRWPTPTDGTVKIARSIECAINAVIMLIACYSRTLYFNPDMISTKLFFSNFKLDLFSEFFFFLIEDDVIVHHRRVGAIDCRVRREGRVQLLASRRANCFPERKVLRFKM